MRGFTAAVVAVGSLLMFALGLISQLTPSEGCPTFLDVCIFALIPALLCLVSVGLVRHVIWRVVLVVEGLAISAGAAALLRSIGCLGLT